MSSTQGLMILIVYGGNARERDPTGGGSSFCSLCSLPRWLSELPSDQNPGHWGRLGCARGARLPSVGAISQSCWNGFFSCVSFVDHFCFICKVEEGHRLGRTKE